jgi:hypothetical protein
MFPPFCYLSALYLFSLRPQRAPCQSCAALPKFAIQQKISDAPSPQIPCRHVRGAMSAHVSSIGRSQTAGALAVCRSDVDATNGGLSIRRAGIVDS